MGGMIFLEGAFSKGFTKMRVEANKKSQSTTVVLFIHGLFGEAGDPRSKSTKLGNALFSSVKGVAYVSTSRDWRLFANAPDKAEAFVNKTFQQERADVENAINTIRSHSEELFGLKNEKLEVWAVANSMGGTLISTVAASYPEIKKIALCGSGILPSSSTLPILSTYPSPDTIRQAAAAFKGDVLHLRGSADTTVSESSQEGLYSSFKGAASIRQVVVDGANHNFSSIHGKNKQKAYKIYTDTIVDFLAPQ